MQGAEPGSAERARRELVPRPPLTEGAHEHVLRVLLTFRAGLTVIAAAPFLATSRPTAGLDGLEWLTIFVIALAGATAVGPRTHRQQRRLLIEFACLPLLILAAALLDDRALGVVPLPHPLDGFAIGTIALTAYLRGWKWSALVGTATIAVELVAAVTEVGVGLATVTLLSQRATWLVVAAAMASFVRISVSRASAAEHAAGQSQERLRQHRALHDRSVQTLTAVVSRAAGWPRVRADAADEAARLQELDQATEPDGPIDALRTLIARRSASLSARLVVNGLPHVSPHVAEAIEGAVDEALTNIEKHTASAPTVITVDGGRGWVQVRIRDTGPGLPDSPAGGFGIRHSIVGRMSAIDGTATVGSDQGAGTTVTLSWAHHAPPLSRWRGPAGRLPWPTAARILTAIAAWQCAASLSILVVAWHRGWVSRPGFAVLACVLPAALGVLVVHRQAARRVRTLLPAVPLALGVLMPAAGAALVMPQHLLMDFADPLTPYATGATAVVAFISGPVVGGVALLTAGGAAILIAPLLNGYPPAHLAGINTVERLLIIASGFYMAIAVGRVVAVDVRQQRWAAIANARVSEAAAISPRLVDTLLAIAHAPGNSVELRQRAFVALAWARHRLSGADMPSAEQLIVVLAEAAAQDVDVVSRPPQILSINRLPSPAALDRLAQALGAALKNLASHPIPVTITARGDHADVRITITRPSGSPPPADVLDEITQQLESCSGHYRLSTSNNDGFRLVLSVPTTDAEVPTSHLGASTKAG